MTSESMETAICQIGTVPVGSLAIITIGDEKGTILPQTDNGASGFPAAVDMITKDKTKYHMI